MLSFLVPLCLSLSSLPAVLPHLCCHLVQENFGICLSARDYENPSLRSQLLNEHIKICGRKPPEEENGSANEGRTKRRLSQFKLARLASLLQGGELELESELMLRALHAGKVEEALKICR